jgi:hypothetical protein
LTACATTSGNFFGGLAAARAAGFWQTDSKSATRTGRTNGWCGAGKSPFSKPTANFSA